MRTALALLLFAMPYSAGADTKSDRAAHAQELEVLSATLLEDIDTVIRKEKDAGANFDFLLAERKAWAEKGILPILPKLLPAVRKYREAKAKADAKYGITAVVAEKKDDPVGGGDIPVGSVWKGTTTNVGDKWKDQPITLVIESRTGNRFKGIERYGTPGGGDFLVSVEGTIQGGEIRWTIPAETKKHEHVGRVVGSGLTYKWSYQGGSSGEGDLRLVRP